MPMTLKNFRAVSKNTLRGFAEIELPSGLILRDVAIHAHPAGRFWAALPAAPMINAEGQHITNAAGKKQYATLLTWRTRDLADRWSDAVIDLIRTEKPDILK